MDTDPDVSGAGHKRCCEGGGRSGRGRGGLLEPLVLIALADGGSHGYDLIRSVEVVAGGAVAADPGGVYRTLRRLEETGLATSSWVEGDSGPQKREYSITAEGRESLGWWSEHLSAKARVFQSIADAAAAASAENAKE